MDQKIQSICKALGISCEKLNDYEKKSLLKIDDYMNDVTNSTMEILNDLKVTPHKIRTVCKATGITPDSFYKYPELKKYLDIKNTEFTSVTRRKLNTKVPSLSDVIAENKKLKERDIDAQLVINENDSLKLQLKRAENEISRLYKLVAELNSKKSARGDKEGQILN